jgi:hypothetical protein
MSTFTKVKLSGGTDGRNIKVAATATPGTLIHTAHASALDELWLWAVNSDASSRKLTLEFGGVSTPDDLIEQTIPPESGLVLIVPGLLLTNALVLRAFAASGNLVLVNGYVNRIG